MSNYTLGIDMGVKSLGWACVSIENKTIDSGVRIFPAGLDNFNSAKEKHANQDRRIARGMRRRIHRKAKRKILIRSILQELGWMPTDDSAIEQWMLKDVYEIRHRALKDFVSLEDFGRIILHFNQRRGFLSLRKTDESKAEKESKGMIGEMNELEETIRAKFPDPNEQTLGNYLHHLRSQDNFTTPKGKTAKVKRLRDRHFRRKLLYKEFSLIWETQAAHHKNILTDALRWGTVGELEHPTKVVKPIPRADGQTLLEQFGIENITFFQRRVYWPENSIGKCELEQDEQRAPIADRRFQEFRMLQEINNLRFTDRSTPGSPSEHSLLDPDMAEIRSAAIAYLTGKKNQKIEALKKHLCKKMSHRPEPTQISFNLESGGRTTISATNTDATLKAKSAYGSGWIKLPEETKNQIITALTLPAATDEDIRDSLETVKDLDQNAIHALLKISLPTGYGHLSIKALKKLLPYMREGKLYMHKDPEKSALAAAGYKRRDEKDHLTLDLLPPFDQVTQPPTAKQLRNNPDFPNYYDPDQVPINNPVVLRSLTEIRKVVNALVKKYGKPARIHLEMARDLKMSPVRRKEHQIEIRGFEKERTEAKELLDKHGVIATGDALQLVRLWKEQKERCPYCDKSISITQLLSGGGEIDVDHIFPFSRSADNSMANKVVCHSKCNATKGNQTPYEWLAHSDHDAYEAMLQRTKHLRKNKADRFHAKEIPEGFTERDLRDTAWMAKAARQYLTRLMPKPHLVQGTKGTHTALLRDHWQLHSLLRHDGIDLKNRDDHRHHALDAILIALCDQTRIKQLLAHQNFQPQFSAAKQEGKKVYHLRHRGDKLKPVWGNTDSFRAQVADSLNAIWVSHRPSRKVSGPLHKETNYGKTKDGLLVVRKQIQTLSKKEIEGIRDPAIYKIIKQFIADHGGDAAALKAISKDEPLTMPSGIPIHKVRTAIPYAHLTIRKGTPHESHVQSQSTHHLAIFSLGDGKHHFEPVTLLEAARRLRAKESIVQKTYPGMPPEAEFLFHLCSNDSMMASIDGTDQLYIFNTMATSTGQVWFAHHTDATQNHKDPDTNQSLLRSCTPGSFEKKFPNARKVTILPTGEIRHA